MLQYLANLFFQFNDQVYDWLEIVCLMDASAIIQISGYRRSLKSRPLILASTCIAVVLFVLAGWLQYNSMTVQALSLCLLAVALSWAWQLKDWRVRGARR